jgi:hypothetical protein
MRRFLYGVAVLAIVAIPTSVRAPIQDVKQLRIDFANEQDAKAKAEWPKSDKFKFSAEGLGRDKGSADRDWIQTKPFAVANSWRPPTGVIIEVKILPPPKAHHRFENGQEIWSSEGDDLYVRYSPDFKHWSSWQPLQRDEKNATVGVFKGELSIPNREYQEYWAYVDQYQKVDLPGGWDEEAICKWILKKEPHFFEHSLPFVGYVQFLFEPASFASWRIRSFEATISWGVSGLGGPDTSAWRVREEMPWRFKAP